jgi:hypothetical protein
MQYLLNDVSWYVSKISAKIDMIYQIDLALAIKRCPTYGWDCDVENSRMFLSGLFRCLIYDSRLSSKAPKKMKKINTLVGKDLYTHVKKKQHKIIIEKWITKNWSYYLRWKRNDLCETIEIHSKIDIDFKISPKLNSKKTASFVAITMKIMEKLRDDAVSNDAAIANYIKNPQ